METIKKINRTLLEMQIGLLIWGALLQIAGALLIRKFESKLAIDQVVYGKSLWFGILLSCVGVYHMYRTLDRGLVLPEKEASKAIFRGYLIRYGFFVLILGIIMVTEVLNPLVVFLAYVGMKVTAYLQPLTHKLLNKVFQDE